MINFRSEITNNIQSTLYRQISAYEQITGRFGHLALQRTNHEHRSETVGRGKMDRNVIKTKHTLHKISFNSLFVFILLRTDN